jgi:regulator of cell morphogenesis and NO signaling
MFKSSNTYLNPQLNISDIVLENPRMFLMLEHFNINVPLDEKTVYEICTENNIDAELFLTIANLYRDVTFTPVVQFNYDKVLSIISFLKKSHHYYISEIYPEISEIIKQMYAVNRNEEISLVEKFFNDYFDEVVEHLEYEDKVAFPYMMRLFEQIENHNPYKQASAYSVNDYKDHHNDIEEKLADLKNLLIKYLPRGNDQKARRKLYLSLHELEHDLTIHAIIEEVVLIPLVANMENQLRKISEQAN